MSVGHVHLLSILSWGILVYQTNMSFCCTSFYNAGFFSANEFSTEKAFYYHSLEFEASDLLSKFS